MNWIGRWSKRVGKISMWPFAAVGKLVVWLAKGNTRYGKIVRQFALVLILVLAGAVYTFPDVVNRPVAGINASKEALASWERLPFRERGFDQWLTSWTVPGLPEDEFSLGLDLQGGIRIVYDIDLAEVPTSEYEQAFDSLRQVVNNRINAFGVSEPRIYIESGDTNRLVVELAGIDNPEAAKQQIGQTPQLQFYLGRPQAETQELIQTLQEQLESGNLEDFQNPYYEEDSPVIEGRNIESASVVTDPNTGEPQVSVRFDAEGREAFATVTRENTGEVLYIVLDGTIVSGPRINEEIPTGEAVISGDFTLEGAKQLVDSLNAGALPVPITPVNEQIVEPTLGQEALNQSVLAAVVGLIVVAALMIVWYRLFGVLAVVSLAMYAVLVLGLFKLLGITITLAGITGFVVSIGLAVDGNILIFERMKEELKNGREFEPAVKEGFKRAWISIRDSQASTFMTALILFYLASGVVQGFAVTLSIGVLISLFTSVSVTRLMLLILGYQEGFLCTKVGKWMTFSNNG